MAAQAGRSTDGRGGAAQTDGSVRARPQDVWRHPWTLHDAGQRRPDCPHDGRAVSDHRLREDERRGPHLQLGARAVRSSAHAPARPRARAPARQQALEPGPAGRPSHSRAPPWSAAATGGSGANGPPCAAAGQRTSCAACHRATVERRCVDALARAGSVSCLRRAGSQGAQRRCRRCSCPRHACLWLKGGASCVTAGDQQQHGAPRQQRLRGFPHCPLRGKSMHTSEPLRPARVVPC